MTLVKLLRQLYFFLTACRHALYIALFGFPAVIGITLGHFVISTTSLVGSIDLYSPIFTFIGLALVRYGGITGIILKKPNLLSGIVAYLIVTSIWMSYVAISLTDASAFPTSGWFIIVAEVPLPLTGADCTLFFAKSTAR